MSEAARSRRDDARYEPQVDVPGRGDLPGGGDPLAELARLVGHDDPFRAVFRPPSAPSHGGQGRDAGYGARPASADDAHAGVHGWDQGYGYDDPHPGQAGQGAEAQGGHDHAAAHFADPYHADAHHADAHHLDPHQPYADEAGLADAYLATDAAAAATLPDMWARQGEGYAGQSPAPDHGAPEAAPPSSLDDGRRSSARRPLAVLAAVLVLTGGGLAASFLVKSSSPGSASVAQGRGAPTIMAAAGPTKVKVDDAAATAPEDKDAALLNKNPGTSSGPVRIVSSQEQPADLGQLPKSAELAEGARPLPPAAPSPFPEPKRVKTFVVHPDGTMLSADGVPAGPGASGGMAGGVDAGARSANRGTTTPATPSATTPRTAAAPTAAPQVAPADALAALAAAPDAAAPAKPVRQPASPGVRTASAKPNDTADSPSAAGGSFGVQLASSPIEASANAAFAKLKKQYPAQLGPLTASVHKAETGDKPIYRVRVGSMSQDEANTLCAQLKGAGGSCFVVHN